MVTKLEIRGGLLARNALLNLIGQLAPILVGLAAVPYIIRRLGTPAFGILAMGAVLLGYLALFDLGLARATTKFVAEFLSRGDSPRLAPLVWTCLAVQLLLGVVGGLIVVACVPALVDRVFHIPLSLNGDAKSTFYILAAASPIVLTTNVLCGVLAAGQRFDLLNYVGIPASALTYLVPAACLLMGFRLRGIALGLVLARFLAALLYLQLCLRTFPALSRGFHVEFRILRRLVGYGSWVTVASVVGSLLDYLDRFLIGSLLSVTMVSYYAAPSDALKRVLLLPRSLIATVFPALSSLDAEGAGERLKTVYGRSVKWLVVLLGPLLLLLMVFARPLLRLWLGADFASNSTLVAQILAVGLLANCLAGMPFSALQALGRPELPALFNLVELPLYLVGLVFLVSRMGIAGAALAWTLRASLDAILLFGAGRWVRPDSLSGSGMMKSFLGVGVLGAALLFLLLGEPEGFRQVILAAVIAGLFAAGAWRFVLDDEDRGFVTSRILALSPLHRSRS
jgi:O-antigen/teichoic acid export membrane protein